MMKVSVIYPHVLRLSDPNSRVRLEHFHESARRFASTIKSFPGGAECDVIVVCINGLPSEFIKTIYYKVFVTYDSYFGTGMDIGSMQSCSQKLDSDFIVCLSSETVFFRDGWLKRLIDCRSEFGEGIYGASASYQACPYTTKIPNPHIRTSCFGMDAYLWREYPYQVESKEDGFKFESGEWNVSSWCEQHGLNSKLVTWDGCWNRNDWRTPPNIFRRGDQSNCLVWDRHHIIYQNASDKEKLETGMMADGKV